MSEHCFFFLFSSSHRCKKMHTLFMGALKDGEGERRCFSFFIFSSLPCFPFSLSSVKRRERRSFVKLLSFRSFIPGCIHEDTPHSAFDALMNHEYLHIILTNVFRYDLHQSVNQMIRCSENVFNCFCYSLFFIGCRRVFGVFFQSVFCEEKGLRESWLRKVW